MLSINRPFELCVDDVIYLIHNVSQMSFTTSRISIAKPFFVLYILIKCVFDEFGYPPPPPYSHANTLRSKTSLPIPNVQIHRFTRKKNFSFFFRTNLFRHSTHASTGRFVPFAFQFICFSRKIMLTSQNNLLLFTQFSWNPI